MSDYEEEEPPQIANEQNYDAIFRAAMELCESYVAWAFEERELHRATRGDDIAKKFRRYLELTHPKEFALMRLAEKGFSIPKLVIHGKGAA